jgi:hypothetical protein
MMNPIRSRFFSPEEIALAERGEALVADARDGLLPSEMIERRLALLVRAASAARPSRVPGGGRRTFSGPHHPHFADE